MDEDNAVVKAFVAPKVGSGSYQLQHMLDRSGQTISYKQVRSRIHHLYFSIDIDSGPYRYFYVDFGLT